MRTITTEKIPIKLWLDDIEDGAMKQVYNLAQLPFAFKHVAVMPDAHSGYGMPIGGVLATDNAIVPNAVGVDIGCGMCAVRTSLTSLTREQVKTILGAIRRRIPLGFEHRTMPMKQYMPPVPPKAIVVDREYASACCQVGTLGGGNHFIELQKGSDGFIWIMIHSGSRNIGKQVADYYNRLAKQLAPKLRPAVPQTFDLAYLPFDTDEGRAYFAEMNYCLAFARANRDLMMTIVKEIVADTVACDFTQYINIHHNYAAPEEHFDRRVMVHRKGATSAFAGELGIVPGSQGTTSYIVKGKGNPESFQSCSHGAGRRMSRHEACRVLDLAVEQRKLDEAGIVHGLRHKRDLDEASSAYKNIDEVMRQQQDLVDVVVSLTPLGVVKG